MDALETIRTRRSAREFLPDPIPHEDLRRILDAARHAPSAGNGQPWRFLVTADRDSLSRLKDRAIAAIVRRIDASDKVDADKKPDVKAQYRDYAERIFAAPVLVLVYVATDQYAEFASHDGALAAGTLLLAAHALGYGSCYQTSLFPEDLVSDHFGVPEGYCLICAVPLGKTPAPPKDPGRRPLDEVVWWESCPADA